MYVASREHAMHARIFLQESVCKSTGACTRDTKTSRNITISTEMEPKQAERLIRIEGGRGRGQPAGIYTSTYIYIQSLIC
jgi:hypothetical protein